STNQYKVAKQEFTHDQYDNLTDTYEYNFGDGAPGTLARHTHTDYANASNLINGINYDTMDTPLRSIPVAQQVFDANGVQRAQTTFEYDNYTQDTNHLHEPIKT